MTAVACGYAELDSGECALDESVVAWLDEDALTQLLVQRFRWFLAEGIGPEEAALLAAVFGAHDAARLALVNAEPAVLQ